MANSDAKSKGQGVIRLRKNFALLLFIALFYAPISTWAIQSTNKFWSLITLTGNYGSFLYNVEPQLRLIEQNNTFNQFLTNAGGGYQVAPSWQCWLGQTISTLSQDAGPGDLEEYRIWEQIIWQHAINSSLLSSRTRLEQRKSLYYATWANRLRERMLINISLSDHLSLALNDEILVNLNQVEWITTKTLDQNRAFIGLVQQLSPSTFISMGYMNQLIFTTTRQSDNVLVLNLQINLPT